MSGDAWDGVERRRSARDTFVDDIVTAVRNEMRMYAIPEDEHREHHSFVQAWIEKQKAREERNERIRSTVIGWFIVTVLGGIGTGTYHAFQYLRDHLK